MTRSEIAAHGRIWTFRWGTYEILRGTVSEMDDPPATDRVYVVPENGTAAIETTLKRCFPTASLARGEALSVAISRRLTLEDDVRAVAAHILRLRALPDPEAVSFDAPTIDETAAVNGWGGPVKVPAMLTPEEAERAYDEATAVPLSPGRIQGIVDYATGSAPAPVTA